jgi:hypothetical protein
MRSSAAGAIAILSASSRRFNDNTETQNPRGARVRALRRIEAPIP